MSEAAWERGILVSSAADAHAGPVVSYSPALITLAARRTLTLAAGYATVGRRATAVRAPTATRWASRAPRVSVAVRRPDCAGPTRATDCC
ncbi:hypothetical protein [Streptomyces sp. NPDC058371]|uniref:hypothetical protein n=1 Tax=Streptomyces sp. NPDC058371 TaxID=3346463 RepID=UPI00365A8573